MQKKFVYSVQEMKALEKEGYTLLSLSYFSYGTGNILYIMAK